jgi:hypothetical protein
VKEFLMALLGLFGKKNTEFPGWHIVAGRISGLLWTAMNNDPSKIANQYSRIVLQKDWNVFLASDKRDPRQILGWGDISYVHIHEESEAVNEWIEELKNNSMPPFQLIATEEFAKKLTRILMHSVDVQ